MSDPGIPPRPIAQISVAAGNPNVLYALATDGTIWRLAVQLGYGWARLPDIPGEGAPAGSSLPSTPI